ncbi:MAG: Fe-S cluster assembly protein SufD, partial [Paracoccaceae bacterium]
MALPKLKGDALAARVAGLPQATSGWLAAAQSAARARLNLMGLPHKRDEYWRYTDPATLVDAEAPAAASFDMGDEPPVFDGIDRLKIVFVDGVFDAAASDDLAMTGVEIARLADVGTKDIYWARDLYAVLEGRGQSPVERPLAALNSAYATDGILIRVTGHAGRPISLIYHHNSMHSDAILHHCIKVEPGASVTLLENGPAAARFNKVMEVDVADG